MTIMEVITAIDNLKHNTYDFQDKVQWLSRLDHRVKRLIIDTHEGGRRTFQGYDSETDADTTLLVPAPFDEMYLRWLEAQIDYTNGEYGKYNNSILMFNAVWEDYQRYYNRTHKPKAQGYKFF